MADNPNKQATSSSDVGQEGNQRPNKTEDITVIFPDGSIQIIQGKYKGMATGVPSGNYGLTTSSGDPYILHFIQSARGTQNIGNSVVFRIQILEEPLTSHSLSTIIAVITDLYTRCWLIQQKRFADLMDYTQSRDPRFVREANLQVGAMSHNSPAIVDLLLNAGAIAGGATTLVFTLTKAIDAVAQTPLRSEAMKLKNQREMQEQAIRARQALLDDKIASEENEIHKIQFEIAAKQQEQLLEAQRKQLDLEQQRMLLEIEKQKLEVEAEKQRTALDRERLEFERNRVIIVQEIAVKMVGQLLSNEDREDAGRTEMLVHSLIPSLLQLAATDAVVTALPIEEPNKENKGP